MQPSVQSFCNALAKSSLLSADEVRSLYQRWVAEAREKASDLGQFESWLEANQYATAYQIGVLNRGRGDQLFLNQYKLLDRIGRGRMAGVYKAVHNLGQTVAVKVLPPSKAKDPTTFGRFQREARLAMRLKHPNIVRTFQTGQCRDLHFLVMEYLEGETLAEVLQRRGKLPPVEAARLIHQALMGLQHMHEEGLVHRDLNPGNLMLVGGPPDSTLPATVKVLDIGMGRALFDEGTPGTGPSADLTAAGEILGSPDCMAPEQARDAHSADIRADVYSLGCVLYHTLTGQPPFPDVNRVRQLVRHAREAPRAVREFNPAVPDGLQQVLNWMLAKDPAQRYPTPERAAQELQVFLTAGPEVKRLEAEPRMQKYLRWLEADGGAQPVQLADVDVNLEPVPAAAPVAPVVVPAAAPQATVAWTAPSGLASPPRQPQPAPARSAAPAPHPPAQAPTPARRGDPGMEKNAAAKGQSTNPEEEPKGFNLSRRDMMMLGLGIGGILVLLLGFGGLFWFLTRNRGKTTPKEPPDASQ